MIHMHRGFATVAALAVWACSVGFGAAPAWADEAAIRKNLGERLPNFPKVDEVSKTAIPGVWELRIGTDILYTDENGDHVIQGSLFDTKARVNVTEKRIEKLTTIDFKTLPLKDAMVAKQGKGTRKIAVFADPNCGYCKRFENDLLTLKDVTIYTFLYPVLGEDSKTKSDDIWCTKDAQKAWREWMIDGKTPTRVMGKCDAAAVERNIAFGRKYRINGTPAILFEDGRRVPGAMSGADLEKTLVEVKTAMAAEAASAAGRGKAKAKS
jgi:thiol:disulfide interchange protein DsbC